MKTIKVLVSFLVLVFAVQVGYSQCDKDKDPYSTVKYKVDAQSDDCKVKIESAVKDIDGAKTVDLNLDSKIVAISYDKDDTNEDAIAKVITDLGYTADVVKRDSKHKKQPCNRPCGSHK